MLKTDFRFKKKLNDLKIIYNFILLYKYIVNSKYSIY